MHLYREAAERDQLTGVATRRRCEYVLERLMALSTRHGQPVSLAVIDLDGFKPINDRAGHAVGDEVLRRLGELLRASFRAEDIVGRWGGDEFVVGMYGMALEDGVQRVSELLGRFREMQVPGLEPPLRLGFSAGVAQYGPHGSDIHQLYLSADDAVYRAKAGGRSRVLPAGARTGELEAVDVVVVEDDDALADVLVHTVETRGLSSRRIADGVAAAELLGGCSPAVAGRVLLLDVDLPGQDGLTVLRRLARDGVLRSTRVIMLTARAAESEVLQALELGAFDHVAKPFSVPVLMQRVGRALEA